VAQEPLISVFIDYENLAIGVRDQRGLDNTVEIGLVLTRLLEKGRIVYKRAYCDWTRYKSAMRALHEQGIVMVDIPQTGMSGKNSADIHMVVDALDLCYSKSHIDVFALLTGDSDFSPLVHKLKENDKRVIGCGVKSSTSNLLVKSCDTFIYYDDLVKRASTSIAPKRAKSRDNSEDRKLEAVEQVVQAVRSLAQDYENVWGSMVKQTVMRLNPGFNHEYHGYKSFDALLKDIEARGLVSIELDRERGNYRIRLSEG
jgi:uncharacterized protein (TIGR00288 family)